MNDTVKRSIIRFIREKEVELKLTSNEIAMCDTVITGNICHNSTSQPSTINLGSRRDQIEIVCERLTNYLINNFHFQIIEKFPNEYKSILS
jgi:hypothetical protein